MVNGLTINTLRGLACLLLVGYHVIGDSPAAGLRLAPDHPAAQVNDWLSLVRMPLFSFLSGLVYALRPISGALTPFVRGKTRRLLVPMLIVGTGFALLQTFAQGTNRGDYDWWTLHLLPVAHYWFLEALFIIFLVTALLERAGWLATPRRFALVFAGAVLLHCSEVMPMYVALNGASFLFPAFLLGVAAGRFHLERPAPWLFPGVLTTVVALIVLLWAFTTPPRANYPGLQRLAVSLAACLLLLRLQPQVKWLAWLGAWSFGIYLFHPVFTAAMRMLLTAAGVQDIGLLFLAGIAAGLVGSITLTAVLRKLPLGYWALGERPGSKGAARRPAATPLPPHPAGEGANVAESGEAAAPSGP